jgi:NADH-quinone oxidoreductase subunit C
MTPHSIAEQIRDKFPEDVLEIVEFRSQVAIVIKKERLKEIMSLLHMHSDYSFDYLVDLCGVDYMNKKSPRFEVVYHLFSIKHRHFLRVRVQVDEDNPTVDTVTDIWKGADWHERECFDMYGIRFEGHPDLRRILMPEDWEGHPLRKDYPLKSDLGDLEWKGYRDLIEFSEKARQYEVR